MMSFVFKMHDQPDDKNDEEAKHYDDEPDGAKENDLAKGIFLVEEADSLLDGEESKSRSIRPSEDTGTRSAWENDGGAAADDLAVATNGARTDDFAITEEIGNSHSLGDAKVNITSILNGLRKGEGCDSRLDVAVRIYVRGLKITINDGARQAMLDQLAGGMKLAAIDMAVEQCSNLSRDTNTRTTRLSAVTQEHNGGILAAGGNIGRDIDLEVKAMCSARCESEFGLGELDPVVKLRIGGVSGEIRTAVIIILHIKWAGTSYDLKRQAAGVGDVDLAAKSLSRSEIELLAGGVN